MGRTAWILLQLVTECHKVIVDATAARIAVSVTTNLLQQLCACDDPIGVLNEKPQSFELMCCQLDRRSEATLFVPASSVARTTEATFVVRIHDGTAEWVNVQTGEVDGKLIEVFGDLHPGDEAASRAPTS